MNIPANQYFGIAHLNEPHSAMSRRLEMARAVGLDIIIPVRFLPHMKFEPFTKDELKDIYGGIKVKTNVSKLRSIIRKAKQKT